MSLERILKSRRAISPILATLLLIVIAVAAIVVTYAWVTTYMGSTTQQAGVILYKENVRFSGSTTVITLGNSGTANTRVVRVYVGDSASNMTDVTSSVTPSLTSGVPLSVGSSATFTVAWPNALAGNWTVGSTYYFRIVPNPGMFLDFQEQAPQ